MIYKEIGIYLSVHRQLYGYSIEDIAEMLDVSPSTVWRWENGIIKISLHYLDQYLHLLNRELTIKVKVYENNKK